MSLVACSVTAVVTLPSLTRDRGIVSPVPMLPPMLPDRRRWVQVAARRCLRASRDVTA